jgi:hypothetical protein
MKTCINLKINLQEFLGVILNVCIMSMAYVLYVS